MEKDEAWLMLLQQRAREDPVRLRMRAQPTSARWIVAGRGREGRRAGRVRSAERESDRSHPRRGGRSSSARSTTVTELDVAKHARLRNQRRRVRQAVNRVPRCRIVRRATRERPTSDPCSDLDRPRRGDRRRSFTPPRHHDPVGVDPTRGATPRRCPRPTRGAADTRARDLPRASTYK